jgi:hypothetical protein
MLAVHRPKFVVATMLGCAGLTGCERAPLTLDGGIGESRVAVESSAEPPMPDEAWLRALAGEVPGFGGAHFEGDELVVLLKDPANAGRARAAMAGGLPAHARGRAASARVAAARFGFMELSEWRDRLIEPASEVPGISYLDLDERRNRVVVAVTRAAGVGHARSLAARLGIPADGVEVVLTDEEVEPLNPEVPTSNVQPGTAATLDGVFRPLVGGVHMGRRGSNPDGYVHCTLGFTAVLGGVPVFVTNSHCSTVSWDTDATIFHQPSPDPFSEARSVGWEFRDRRGVSCGFLSYNVCRYADATTARIAPGTTATPAAIARTTFHGSSNPGSKVIDPSNPTFSVVAKGAPMLGQYLNKMGSRTGWTRGLVSQTCVVTYQAGRTFSKLRCQFFVQAAAERGDSGAPVFLDHGNGEVTLMGILWGKQGPECNILAGYCDPTIEFVFSPISGIEADLGTLTVTVGGTQPGGSGGTGGPSDCDGGSDPYNVVEPC